MFTIPINDHRIKDLTNQRFGKLKVIGYLGKAKPKGALWLCACDCGNGTKVSTNGLNTGHTKSCGCLQIEIVTTHNMSYSSEYKAWDKMKHRCYNKTNKSYSIYGGRGIKVCDRWLESFDNFITDMGLKPSPRHSLDRKNNDKDYELSNCRWATQKMQIRNRSNSIQFEWEGVLYSAIELAEKYGIPFDTLRSRLYRGWSLQRALGC